MVQIPAHVLSFSVLLAPALVYSAYAYKQGTGEENLELERRLVSQSFCSLCQTLAPNVESLRTMTVVLWGL